MESKVGVETENLLLSVFGDRLKTITVNILVAQLDEQRTSNALDAGSSPVEDTKKKILSKAL